MMIFFNVLTSLLTAYFISSYFHFENKKKYILLTTIVLLLFKQVSASYHYNGLFLYMTCWLCTLLSMFIYNRKVTLDHLYISLLYYVFIVANTVIWSLIKDSLIFLNIQFYYLSFITLLQIIETVLLLKIKDQLALRLDNLNWKIISIFELILIFFVYFFSYLSLLREISYKILIFCIITMLIMCIMFMNIIYLINKDHGEKLKILEENQQREYQKKKYNLINTMKNNLEDKEHRFFYALSKIEILLKNKDYKELHHFITEYKKECLKYNIVIHTHNDEFDVLYSAKINELLRKDIDVNSCLSISKNKVYDDFVDLFNQLLDCFVQCQAININLHEMNQFVVLRIMYLNGNIDLDEIEMILNKEERLSHLLYNIEDIESRGLRVSFSIDNE